MAVFDRSYRPYAGPVSPRWSRVLAIPRFAYRDVFKSRLFTSLFTGCFGYPLIAAAVIYVRNNVTALDKLGLEPSKLFAIDAPFFLLFLSVQAGFGFALAMIMGPALVSPDLVNGALPLYLSRPISRAEYVLGKFAVLGLLISLATWVPGVLLFLLQASLSNEPWAFEHLRLLAAVVGGALLYIAVISLFALAVSAWVKSKPVSRGIFLAALAIPSGVGENLNHNLHTKWGHLFQPTVVFRSVWASFLGARSPSPLPVEAFLAVIAAIVALSLLLLWRKLKAYEVVR